jgi:allantoicase
MNNVVDNPFHQWIRLEQPRLGSKVVFATDEFFAPRERLIDAADPVFILDKYDDHGKWMDGWESRRKRTQGYDFCIIRLGIPGVVRGFDIDTRHFTGNYPPAASIDGCNSDQEIPGDNTNWHQLLSQTDIDGDSHNYRALESDAAVTHLRLNIFPDGGIARLRIYGEVRPDAQRFDTAESLDLIAMQNGGRAICCSDEHYGSMHNLNLPDRGTHMGDGWETARRRGPGNDWVVFELGKPGVIEQIEIDTAYFKGNYPDRAEVRAANVVDRQDIESVSEHWPVLLDAMKLEMDRSHIFRGDIHDLGVVSHLRLSIFPDGGVSRLRVMGKAS